MSGSDLTQIYGLLDDRFSDDELRDLCLRLGVDYESLPPGGKRTKARELVLYLDRRGRLSELRAVVAGIRPDIVWPAGVAAAAAPTQSAPAGIALNRSDFDRLVGILAGMADFQSTTMRRDFMEDVFAGSPRKADVLSLLNLDGTPRGVAVRVVTRLTQFGQDEPGQETLGVLVNKLLSYTGGGADADFLRDLFGRYPLHVAPAAGRGVDDWHGRESPQDVQEKVIGENTLRDVRMLELALQAARAVVRISTSTQLGTGFVIAPGLVMTNHHLIGSAKDARDCLFTFNYQLDRDGLPAPERTTGTLRHGLFYTNANLDVTVVEVQEVPEDVMPLALSTERVRRDERVNIIQHPGGHYKKISMQNNFVAFADDRTIQYLTTTEKGSSGSPVFDNDFQVVGIHHSGGDLLEPGTKQRYLRNAGSTMVAVLDDLRQKAPDIYARLPMQS